MSFPMPRRRFGRTELPMPVLTCGGMRYQHGWKDVDHQDIPDDAQRNLEATIRHAVEHGINHIETARGYGTSEYQLGKILPVLPRESLIVQTKVPPRETAKEFLETFEISMERLRLERVDLLGIHGINTEDLLDMTLRKGGTMDAVRQLQKEGRVGHVGFSTHGHPDSNLKAVKTGEFDYINLHWYYVEQRNWKVIEEATRQDMGVFIISPNDKGGKLYEPPDKLVQLCDPLTPMGFNDLFCLSHPQVHTLSIGASKPSDFDAHVEILPHVDNAAETIAPVEARLRAALIDVWGQDWIDNWEATVPRYEMIPGQVNIYQILRLYTLAKGLGMEGYAKMRYNMLGNGGHWFPGFKVDLMEWDKLGNALQNCRFAEQIPAILREAHEALDAEAQKRLSES